MRIVNILFNVRWIELIFATVAAGIIVLFFCSPLWGYIVNFHQQPPSVSVQKDCKIQTTDDRLIRLHDGYFAKRRSSNQDFRQWQDLSPKEQEKLRKKYKEWQALRPAQQQLLRQRMNQLNQMPSQKRNLYKQLFRQWQHLPPKERKQLQKDLNNWENLSPQQRKSIRRRFKN